jgi:hypothetical protein
MQQVPGAPGSTTCIFCLGMLTPFIMHPLGVPTDCSHREMVTLSGGKEAGAAPRLGGLQPLPPKPPPVCSPPRHGGSASQRATIACHVGLLLLRQQPVMLFAAANRMPLLLCPATRTAPAD